MLDDTKKNQDQSDQEEKGGMAQQTEDQDKTMDDTSDEEMGASEDLGQGTAGGEASGSFDDDLNPNTEDVTYESIDDEE